MRGKLSSRMVDLTLSVMEERVKEWLEQGRRVRQLFPTGPSLATGAAGGLEAS